MKAGVGQGGVVRWKIGAQEEKEKKKEETEKEKDKRSGGGIE